MKFMKKILVPCDFSPVAEKAFEFALNHASKSNGIVVLYHVYIPVRSTFMSTYAKRSLYNAKMEKIALERLQLLKIKLAGECCDTPVQTIVGCSPITDSILNFAEQNSIDLIVMGTMGANGIKKVILGSIASRIAEESQIPVLLIPENFEWKEPERIVFATNYDSSDLKAINLSIELAKVYKSRVILVHVFKPTSNNPIEDNQMMAFKTGAENMQKSFSDFTLRFCAIRTTAVGKTLRHLNREISFDILVMLRRNKNFLQRFFMKSFTKALSYGTKFPLLIVPANYLPKPMAPSTVS